MTKELMSAAAGRKKEYDAPMVEQIEARVEKGFTTSSNVEQTTNPEQIGNSGFVYDLD